MNRNSYRSRIPTNMNYDSHCNKTEFQVLEQMNQPLLNKLQRPQKTKEEETKTERLFLLSQEAKAEIKGRERKRMRGEKRKKEKRNEE